VANRCASGLREFGVSMGDRVLQVKVKANARASRLTVAAEGPWLAELKSPPVDGRANAELIALVAAHFGCARHAVTIRSGAGSRMKWLRVTL
jgi:uncharacterized protein